MQTGKENTVVLGFGSSVAVVGFLGRPSGHPTDYSCSFWISRSMMESGGEVLESWGISKLKIVLHAAGRSSVAGRQNLLANRCIQLGQEVGRRMR